MARLAIWIGNVRNRQTGIVQNNSGERLTQRLNQGAPSVVELDEGVNNITHAFPYYISASTSNTEGNFDLKIIEAQLVSTYTRATAITNSANDVTLVASDEDPLRTIAQDATSSVAAIAQHAAIGDITDTSKGKYRFTYGKGVYALGYVWTTSGSAATSLAECNDISNVVWK